MLQPGDGEEQGKATHKFLVCMVYTNKFVAWMPSLFKKNKTIHTVVRTHPLND
jgi:hypothetical protein